jgi:hypothetical protein
MDKPATTGIHAANSQIHPPEDAPKEIGINEDVDHETYSHILCNRLPSKFLSKMIIFCLALISGMQMGAVYAGFLTLMETVSWSRLSIYTTVYYPLSYKMFFGPVVDLFFIKKLGKCKTYLVLVGLVLSTAWFILSQHMDHLLKHEEVGKLTVIWFCLFQTLVFYQCAADMFLLKISPEVTRAELSIYQDIGAVLGEFITYNLFLPLNSLKFLNKFFYSESPRTVPLLTFEHLLIFMATVALITTLVILFFIAEIFAEHEENKITFKEFGKVIPRFFSRTEMIKLVVYIIIIRLFRFLVDPTVYPKLVSLGFSKADIANVDTLIFPVYYVINFFILKLMMVPGKLMVMHHLMNFLCLMGVLYKCLLVFELEANHNPTKTFWLYTVAILNERFTFRSMYLAGFVSTIAPLQVGSTFVSLFMSLNMATQSIPTSLGLWLSDILPVSYTVYALGLLGTQTVVCLATFNYAAGLDTKDKSLFDVTKADGGDREEDPLLELSRSSNQQASDVSHFKDRVSKGFLN